jgi:hypothetical protein
LSGSLFLINDRRHETFKISSGESHTRGALAEALMKDEALERVDAERILQDSTEEIIGLDPGANNSDWQQLDKAFKNDGANKSLIAMLLASLMIRILKAKSG